MLYTSSRSDFVRNGLDAFLKGQDLVIAGHHRDGPEFESFGQMHGADGEFALLRLDIVAQHDGGHSGLLRRGDGSIQFMVRADEDTDLVRHRRDDRRSR